MAVMKQVLLKDLWIQIMLDAFTLGSPYLALYSLHMGQK